MIYPSVKTLLKDLSCVPDNSESARLCLNILVESVNRLKSGENNIHDICREAAAVVRKSRPGNTPLMALLDFFESDLGALNSRGTGVTRQGAVGSLEEKVAQMDRYGEFVAENGLIHVKEGDTIFLLQPDTVIEALLIQAGKELGLKFRVVILDCGESGPRTFESLAAQGIDVRNLPPGTDPLPVNGNCRLFMGGMTVTADRTVFVPQGTAEILDRFRSNGGKIHFFATSLWFSRQRSTAACFFGGENKTGEVSPAAGSWDQFGLDRIDHIITEFGEVGVDGRILSPPVSLARLKAGQDGTKDLISAETARREMSAA